MKSDNWLRYKEICQANGDKTSIFSQPWWIEAVSGTNEKSAFISNGLGGELTALPYVVVRKLGMKFILMPQLTQFFSATHLGDTENGGKQLLSALREHYASTGACLAQLCAYLTDEQVEQAQKLGFEVKTRVSYQLTDLKDVERVETLFCPNNRRRIKKATDLHEKEMSGDDFYEYLKRNLSLRGQKPFYSRELFLSMFNATTSRGQGKLVCIADSADNTCAAIFIVFDTQACYYLITSFAPEYAKTGAMTLATLRCIEFAKNRGLTFDFEGSMNPRIAQAFKQYGGKPTTYYELFWYKNALAKWGLKAYMKLRGS